MLLGHPEDPREVRVDKTMPEREIENLARLRRQHRVAVERQTGQPISARGVAGVGRDLLADADTFTLGARQGVEPRAKLVGLAQLTDAVDRDDERVAQRVPSRLVIAQKFVTVRVQSRSVYVVDLAGREPVASPQCGNQFAVSHGRQGKPSGDMTSTETPKLRAKTPDKTDKSPLQPLLSQVIHSFAVSAAVLSPRPATVVAHGDHHKI